MSDQTLAHFFAIDESEPNPRHLEVVGASAAVARARETLQGKPPSHFWPSVSRAVTRSLGQALHVNLVDVLVSGWKTYAGLVEYTNRAEHPPGEISQVALEHRTISSSHEPHIDVLVGSRRVAEIHFAVELALEIDSVILTIQDAKIKEIATGKCVGKGTLKCEGAVLVEQKTREIELPGRITLGAGIAINPDLFASLEGERPFGG